MRTKLFDRAAAKARTILTEAFGEDAAHLFTSTSTAKMIETTTTAFSGHISQAKAKAVGFHLGDWAQDAALVVALHLFPKRFTRAEIRQITDCLAAHLPYHCSALAALFGYEGMARDGIRDGKKAERPTRAMDRTAHPLGSGH